MSASSAAIALALAGAAITPAPTITTVPLAERQHAPSDGWAAQEGGTRGGALASPEHVYTVRDRPQLLAALSAAAPARIVRVAATIDMSEGRSYGSTEDQAQRGAVRIPANTTLIGVTPGAGFINGSLAVVGVSQVVIRNLAIRNPCDVGPRWDPKDGSKGNWNSSFDGILVSNSHHVWIDHNSFTDAPDSDDKSPVENGMLKQCHDGALDINQAADFVSVTYNRFAQHEKNMLIGSSDRATGDASHLRVTLKGNLFEHVAERAPRVRYGQVHVLNNYYVGDRKRPVYGHHYSIGVAHASHIVSDANAFDILGAASCRDVVRDPGNSPGVFVDNASLLNGAALKDCPYGGNAGWRAPYGYTPLPAAEVARHVLEHAGPRPLPAAAADGYAEARFVPRPGAPFVLRARQDANGDWQGASLQLASDGKMVVVELLESRGGEVKRIKQVRRNAPPPGPIVLRYTAEPGPQGSMLNVLVDGERATWLVAPAMPAVQPVSWDAGASQLLDLRGGPAGAPERVTPNLVDRIVLQAGDAPETVRIGGATRIAAESADPRIAVAETIDGVLRVKPLAAGSTTVTVRSLDDAWAQAIFTVDVGAPFAAPAATTHPAAAHPAKGERGVPPDTPLRLVFAEEPVLSGQCSVRVYRKRDGALVAVIRPGETVTALGSGERQRLVRQRAITVSGKELRMRLPVLLEYGADYEAVVDAGLVRANGFKGARWSFRTTPYRPVGDSVSVDDDGRADFRTVQGALDYAMSLPRDKALTVNVRDGVYPELLYLGDKDNITLRGQSRDATIIRAPNSETRNPGSGSAQAKGSAGLGGGRALFLAQDSDLLEIRDIALHNSTRRSDGHSAQAETLFFASDQGRLQVRNAHFVSEQDTLQLWGYAWFYRSLIEGNVDFVWGNNHAALFEESELRTVGDSANPDSGGYIVQARTLAKGDPGFVFLRSRITRGPGPLGNLPPIGATYFARSPGTANTWDNVAFIECTVGPHIAANAWYRKPVPNPVQGGWSEYGNRSEDGQPRSYGGFQLEREAAARLSNRAAVFAGRGWNPQP
ncbi:pectinesterase family protein [Massilia sp. IC2-476]|uniref:pectinesterase family protein n=1 Tax=Massilia sp. IC2-476 TaxID=2887199 RepID=UPI001D12E625|nr:pectinesterase family protein [Massilia sp. IC2-476]MCC2973304.1 pectinesterase family protein [Massilia sp. IC2-476]